MLNDFIHKKFEDEPKIQKKSKRSKKEDNLTKREVQKEDGKEASKIGSQDPKKQTQTKTEGKPSKDKQLTRQIREKFQEFIGHKDLVPDYIKDNEFIHGGYRINFSTPKKVLKSLFMVHNESVNIWTHLAGAIFIIILCVVLCFSVSSLDTQNFKTFVEVEVKELFEPVYNQLPNFSKIENDLSEKISQTKVQITKFGENTIKNLEDSLDTISKDIEQVKENVNAEAVGKLLTRLKDQLEDFSHVFNDIKNSVSKTLDKEKIENASNQLKNKLIELQDEFISEIDSSELDWIDVYRFIKPNHSNSETLRDGHHRVPLSRWPIIAFLLSAVFCLMCSAIFHLFYCLGQRANQILLRLDYAGVSILITGSCFPPLVYGFYCQPIFAKIYLSIIGFTSIIVFFVSLGDTIHSQPYRHIKSLMYGGLGIFAALPIIHLVLLTMISDGPSDNLNFVTSLPYYLAMGFSYLGGLTIYSYKCPERFLPGKFDIIGHSHQIWHVCVLLGIVFTYFGAFDNYYTRMKIPCIGCGL